MSWNCLFMVARNTNADVLATIGLQPVGATITAEEATTRAFNGVAMLQHGADTVLINSDNSLLTGGAVMAQLLGREMVTALFAGTSDSYLWRVDSPGLERTWMSQGGETLDQTGIATPEEYGVFVLDEDSLFGLLARRTGFGSSDAWLHQPVQPISWPPSGPAPKEKKRWFARSTPATEPQAPGSTWI